MEFSIDQYPSLVNWAGEYYPMFKIDIDGDYIASELENVDMSGDEVNRLVRDCECDISKAVSNIITKKAYKRFGDRAETKTNVPVCAEITHCAWSNDYLFEGESDWVNDCTVVLDQVEFDRLPKPENVAQAASDGNLDYIYTEGVKYGICEEWSGPYNVYVNEDDYRHYYDARETMEGE